MTQEKMINELMELGYSESESKSSLYITNFNFEEAKELLYVYTTSSVKYIVRALLKLRKDLEKDKCE